MSHKDGKQNTAGPEGKSGCAASEQSEEAGAPLTQEVSSEIAKHLRQLYGQRLAEPLPEKFTSLLAQLSRAEADPIDLSPGGVETGK
jgi:hypothetical protein